MSANPPLHIVLYCPRVPLEAMLSSLPSPDPHSALPLFQGPDQLPTSPLAFMWPKGQWRRMTSSLPSLSPHSGMRTGVCLGCMAAWMAVASLCTGPQGSATSCLGLSGLGLVLASHPYPPPEAAIPSPLLQPGPPLSK